MATTMYPAKINSPIARLLTAIAADATTIPLIDASTLPDAPNIATIGVGENCETIYYGVKSGDNLTSVTRGFQGTAIAWSKGELVYRAFTAYDHDTFKSNIEMILPLSATAYIIPSNALAAVLTYGNFLRSLGYNVWVCDTVNDELQFQAGIDNFAGLILLEAGNYTTINTTTLANYRNLRGQGQNSTKILHTGNDYLFTFPSDVRSPTVKDMGMSSYRVYDKAAFYAPAIAYNVRLTNLDIYEFLGSAISFITAVDLRVEDCRIRYCGSTTNFRAAVYINSPDLAGMSTFIHFIGVDFEPNYYADVYIRDWVNDVLFDRCYWEGSPISGVYEPSYYHVIVGGFNSSGVHLNHCRFYDPASSTCGVLRLYGVVGFSFTNSTLQSGANNTCQRPIWLDNPQLGIIDNVQILWSSHAPTGCVSIWASNCSNVTISNCKIYNVGAGQLLYLVNDVSQERFTIRGNSFYNGVYSQIYATGSAFEMLTIEGNLFDTPVSGIAINLTNYNGPARIFNNKFTGCAAVPVLLNPARTDQLVYDNDGYTAPSDIKTIAKTIDHADITDGGGASGYTDFPGAIPAGSIIKSVKFDYTQAFNSDNTTTLTIQVGPQADLDAFNKTASGENGFNTTTDAFWGESACQDAVVVAAATPRITFTEDNDITHLISGAGAQGTITITITYMKA